MKKYMFVTVGTSIINQKYKNKNKDLPNKFLEKNINKIMKNEINYPINIFTRQMLDYINDSKEQYNKISAEINSIYKYIELRKQEDANLEIEVYFIISDSIKSFACAKFIQYFLLKNDDIKNFFSKEQQESFKKSNEFIEDLTNEKEDFKNQDYVSSFDLCINHLRTDKNESFNNGIDNLIGVIRNKIDSIKDKEKINKKIDEKNKEKNNNEEKIKKEKFEVKDQVIFNITGGYKGVSAYVSLVAQLYGCDVIYTFEDTENNENELINMPNLPLGFDPIETEECVIYLDMIHENIENFYKYYDNIIDKLCKYKFAKKTKNSFQITALGKLFKDISVKEQTTSKNALGFFIEYKLYKFLTESDNYNTCVKNFKHSYEIYSKDQKKRKFDKEYSNQELDFVFGLNDGRLSHNMDVWEVKSALNYKKNYKRINTKLREKITILKENNCSTKKIILVLYSSIEKYFENEIINKIEKIKKDKNNSFDELFNIDENLKEIEIRFLYLSGFDEEESYDNKYKTYMSKDISKEDFSISYTIKENKNGN